MAIFSLGGLALASHLRGRSVRCRTGFVGADGTPRVVLDPYPGPGGKAVVEDGVARLLRDGEEVARSTSLHPGRRWDDLDVAAFAATTLWTWIGLPLALDRPELQVRRDDAGRRVEVTVPDGWPATSREHVLSLDGEGRVVRHEEVDLVHHLSGHCEFGTLTVATSRRTRVRDRLPVLWADVVAAAFIPEPLN